MCVDLKKIIIGLIHSGKFHWEQETQKERKKKATLTQLHQIPSHLHLLFLDGLQTFIKSQDPGYFFLHWVKAEKFKQPNPDAKFLKAHHNIDTKSKLVLYLSSTIRCLENRLYANLK